MKKIALIAFLILATVVGSHAQEHNNRMRFGWGASLTSSVDLSGNDMSVVGMDAYFGIRGPVVQMLGIGAGVNMPVSNSLRSMPVYLLARTNFRNQPSLCFLDLRCGISINDLPDSKYQTGEYGSIGVGINLASSRKFSSHLILAYTLIGRKAYEHDGEIHPLSDLHMATIRLGISF